ncbi:unnamed protein product [Choristocarpus tenellus]
MVLARLPYHRNVVKVLTFSNAGSRPSLTMEAGQQSLHDMLHSKRFNIRLILRCFVDCARGIAHLHRHHLVHSDIKLKNMVANVESGRWRGVMIDFGLTYGEGEPMRGSTITTRAPECDLSPTLTHQQDVFSLGASLLHILTENFDPFFQPDFMLPWEREAYDVACKAALIGPTPEFGEVGMDFGYQGQQLVWLMQDKLRAWAKRGEKSLTVLSPRMMDLWSVGPNQEIATILCRVLDTNPVVRGTALGLAERLHDLLAKMELEFRPGDEEGDGMKALPELQPSLGLGLAAIPPSPGIDIRPPPGFDALPPVPGNVHVSFSAGLDPSSGFDPIRMDVCAPFLVEVRGLSPSLVPFAYTPPVFDVAALGTLTTPGEVGAVVPPRILPPPGFNPLPAILGNIVVSSSPGLNAPLPPGVVFPFVPPPPGFGPLGPLHAALPIP